MPSLVGVDDPGELAQLSDDSDDILTPAADARVGDAGHSFQTFSPAIPCAAEGIPQVDDQVRVAHEPVVVDVRVCSRDDDRVVGSRLERLRRQRRSVLGEGRHMRIVIGDVRAGVLQQLDQLDSRRLAHVGDVRLVGHAEHQDP